MATGTPGDSAATTVNWSVRLDPADAESWDDLLHALRRETGRRTLTKATLFRALIDTAEDAAARRRLIEILTA
ncbi:hypothetical protein [Nocardia grenadensis]|uniref:hypothetical protein n=1 Tax=Nocardia TaxID=1817 RepID=UPI0007A422E7|nr:hypothetical protein [Nocardia grenadensis]